MSSVLISQVLIPALLFVKNSFYPTSIVIQLNEDGPIALGPDAIKVSPWITAYNADVYLFIFYVFVGYPVSCQGRKLLNIAYASLPWLCVMTTFTLTCPLHL